MAETRLISPPPWPAWNPPLPDPPPAHPRPRRDAAATAPRPLRQRRPGHRLNSASGPGPGRPPGRVAGERRRGRLGLPGRNGPQPRRRPRPPQPQPPSSTPAPPSPPPRRGPPDGPGTGPRRRLGKRPGGGLHRPGGGLPAAGGLKPRPAAGENLAARRVRGNLSCPALNRQNMGKKPIIAEKPPSPATSPRRWGLHQARRLL